MEGISLRPLTPYDVQAAVELEAAAFPADEAASPEAVRYRIVTCPELCVGLFHNQKTLIGHVLATKTDAQHVTEDSMKVGGHQEHGDTIALHSVVVAKEYRGKKLARLMIRDYLQRMAQQEVAKWVILLSKDSLKSFYQNLGFEVIGKSDCHHGGEEWLDMRIELVKMDDE